jgi:hypothetical protein
LAKRESNFDVTSLEFPAPAPFQFSPEAGGAIEAPNEGDAQTMVLKIFLDDKSFHCLKQSIPPGSHSKLILDHAVHLNLFGSNAVVSCDVTEARNLLLYAGHCPGVVASVHKALRSAGLTIDGPTSL